MEGDRRREVKEVRRGKENLERWRSGQRSTESWPKA